jgi:hypothetical protein
MLGRLKINTAVLICSAFIFRLLFVNIGLVSSLNTRQNNSTIKHLFSTVIKKRRKQFDPITNTKNSGYSTVEILEEDSNDEELFKLNSFPLLFIFYSKIENKIKDTLKKITPFNKHFSFNSSNRHVEYQVFRI